VTLVEFGSGAALAAAMSIVVVGAGAQVVTGFGFSLVVVPVLVLLVGPAHAVPLANLMAAVLNATILGREFRVARYADALRLLLPAVVVTPLAAYLVHRTRASVLSIVVGVAIIGSASALAVGVRSARLRGARWMVAAGGIGAAMNTASGVGGPAVAMYAVNAGWPMATTRPTMQVYFLGLNIVTLAALGPVRVHPGAAVALATAIAAGVIGGFLVVRRMQIRTIERGVIALALLGGTAAVVRGIVTG